MNQYDALKASIYDGYFNGVDGDLEFYVDEAVASGGSVLELGCGTARITIPIAEAGVRVTGLDSSPDMLNGARLKLAHLSEETRGRITLLEADMRSFDLHRRYKLVLIPYRSFMHLLTPEDQINTLLAILDHLRPGGRLIFNIYDPMQELVLGDRNDGKRQFDTEFTHPTDGTNVKVWYDRYIDITSQTMEQRFYFEQYSTDGAMISRYDSPLTLRYSHRYEMHYLLEMCGYKVTALYGDFSRGPYTGAEQIWIAAKPATTTLRGGSEK